MNAGSATNVGPPFVVKKLESQARRYSQGRLVSCLRAIHETDTALKGAGSLRPEMALERLVLGEHSLLHSLLQGEAMAQRAEKGYRLMGLHLLFERYKALE